MPLIFVMGNDTGGEKPQEVLAEGEVFAHGHPAGS